MGTGQDSRTINDALAEAQAEMTHAKMDRVNPHFHSRYATLASIIDACRPLAKRGISIVQRLGSDAALGTVSVKTELRRGAEVVDCGELTMKAQQNTPQGIGSALTYARRYALAAAVCIAADEDDDGEAAEKHGASSVPAATVLPPRAPAPARAREHAPAPAAAPPAAGDFAFKVGKHKGVKASLVPTGYLEWYLDAKLADTSKWEGKAWEADTRHEIAVCRALIAAHVACKEASEAPAARQADEPPPPDAPAGEFDDDPNVPF